MGHDKKKGRYTYQFVISAELREKLDILRERFPTVPPPAPLLRQGLEQYVAMFDEVLTALQNGESQEQLIRRLNAALGLYLTQAFGQIAAVQSPPEEVKGKKIEKKKARS